MEAVHELPGSAEWPEEIRISKPILKIMKCDSRRYASINLHDHNYLS
jgi:hypothetical protein